MLQDVGKRKQGGGEEFLMRKEDDHRGIVEDGTTTVRYLCNQGHVSVLDTTTVATTRNQRRYYTESLQLLYKV